MHFQTHGNINVAW